jgi:hypothetical protein
MLETDANIKYLRYAEVVLMKAEALNELDQTGPAIILLNDIRRRAQLLPTTALSKAHRTAIYKERRVELAFEHDRFYDLVRTGQLLQHLRFMERTLLLQTRVVLPQSFTQANGLSTQNPNY